MPLFLRTVAPSQTRLERRQQQELAVAKKQDAAMAMCLAGGGATKHANGRVIEQVVLYCICSESKEFVLVEMKLDTQDASNDHAIEHSLLH